MLELMMLTRYVFSIACISDILFGKAYTLDETYLTKVCLRV
jgi:hypothetical protein